MAANSANSTVPASQSMDWNVTWENQFGYGEACTISINTSESTVRLVVREGKRSMQQVLIGWPGAIQQQAGP